MLRSTWHATGRAAAPAPARQVIGIGLLVFLAFGLAIIALSWHIISATGVESSDFAANSILIQDAKHFRLTLGNYSRIGVNHPGPAILYVLAAGEALFHDVLGWVTPIGGQLIAACLYNAAWLGLTAVLLRTLGLTTGSVLTTLAVTVLALAWRDARAFDSLWFPYLYVLPFLAFVTALTGVACGKSPAWIAVAVCAGVLVNGHVSFVGICGIAVILIAIQSLVVHRRSLFWPLCAGVTFALFLVPLASRELTERPGPIEEYARFANTNEGQTFANAARFLVHAIGAAPLELSIVALAFLSLAVRGRDPLCRGIVLSAVAAGLGTFYYVLKGVDHLEFGYLVIFFAAVPSLLVGFLARDILGLANGVAIPYVAAGAALSLWAVILHRDTPFPEYNRPEVAQLDSDLARAEPHRFALTLNMKLWPTIVGVESKRVREGRSLGFCIKNWHVLFAAPAKCTSDDDRLPSFAIDETASINPSDISPVLTSGPLTLYQTKQPCIQPGDALTVAARPKAIAGITIRGWNSLEDTFVWSEGHTAALSLCLDRAVKALDFDLRAFLPQKSPHQHVGVRVSGKPLTSADFDDANPTRHLVVPIPQGHPREVEIEFDLPDAISPADAKSSNDDRIIAIALSGIYAN